MGSRLVTCILVLICSALMLIAQSDRGVITGTVRDASGAVVPNARILAVHLATNTNFRTTSTTSGDFTLPSLPVGNYQVRVELEGFKTSVRESVVVGAGGTVRLDVAMEVGMAQQTVEVSASVQMLQSETARLQTQVSTRLIDELPLVVGGAMRSPFDLAAITPEVGGEGRCGEGPCLAIGGGKTGQFGITLDGVSASTAGATQDATWIMINTPSVDAITEFTVEAGGFKAEHGHSSGGSISFVSKSGTNEFHGTAYEFLRNNALDSRGFFEASKRVYKQHNFGATAGGPVWIPKVYDGREKTFFFFSYEGFRNSVGASATPYSVPVPEFYQGDFRNWVDQNNRMIPIYDPATQRQEGGKWIRTPFADNQIPLARFDNLSKALIPFGSAVKPNAPGLVPGTSAYVRNNYISTGTSKTPFDKTSVRIDHYLTTSHRLAFYFGRTVKDDIPGANGFPGLPPPLTYTSSGTTQLGYRMSDVYRVSWDWTLSPRLLNRFYAGGNNWREDHWSHGHDELRKTGKGWKDRVCMINVPDCDDNLTKVSFAGEFSQWGGDAPNGSDNIVVSFKDDMTFISGAHSFKWGYAYDNTLYAGIGRQNVAGYTTFNRLSTSVPLDTNMTTGGGSAFAAFLLGEAYSGTIDTPRYVPRHYRYHAWYFQDDWRVNSRLTLNLGVRYEFQLPPLDGRDQMSDLDPLLPNPGADGYPGAIIFAGTGPGRTGSRSMVPGYYGAVGPRLGFSYMLDNKTVIRGSATRSFGWLRGGPRHAQGFFWQLNFPNTNQGLTRTFKYEEGMPYWPPLPNLDPAVANGASAAWFQGKEASRQPENLGYTFNIQRQLSNDFVFEIGYNGVMGSHIQGNPLNYNQIDHRRLPEILNPFTAAGRALLNSNIYSAAAIAAGITPPYPSFNGTVAQSLRPFPQYTGIDVENRGGHSTYHSLMLKIEKRHSAGLTFQGSYLLSKTLTDADSGSGIDHFNRRLEKAIASYDQTHSVKMSYVYDLPFGPGKRFLSTGLASKTLGGWRISAIQTYTSGTPVALGTTISFPIFNSTNRPLISTYDGWRGPISGDKFDPNVDSFFQPLSFFPAQPNDRFGDATRRNPKLRSFPNFNENFSLAKSFQFSEDARLDLRLESFNLFNRARFGPLSNATTLQNFNFGLWQQQINEPRRMQIGLKLYW